MCGARYVQIFSCIFGKENRVCSTVLLVFHMSDDWLSHKDFLIVHPFQNEADSLSDGTA